MFPITRREALKKAGIAGAGLVMAPITIRGQATPVTVAGRPVEIATAPGQRLDGADQRAAGCCGRK